MENIDKILIVDNEEHHLRSLLQTLEGESREILFTQTAKEAMGIIHKNKVDLVIATYGMPEMSGLELVKNIRELKPEITRILLSDTTDIEVMIKALNRGDVFNFLVEPCEKNLTRDIVEKGLKQRLRIMERRKSEHLQLEKVTLETAMSLA
ncbi:response regulator, partial [bacterium]|nr:response regulator [bacterium]